MTERLYLNDSYIQTTTARVTACTPTEGGYDVELDRTVLFPTGGGQPHDTGFFGGVPVTDVVEDGERVLHRTATPFNVGSEVTVTLDWPRRFDHMQQHSGEHLLSFAAKELFGAKNVGFHMAAAYCTVDLDIPLGPGDAARLEESTNALMWENMPVGLSYVTAEELEGMTLRKKAAGLSGMIRIVAMPGGDSCTCCGTHVAHTGEIGMVKITSNEHYKGGERITFACGGRALAAAQFAQDALDSLARSFSCKAVDVATAVDKLSQEAAGLRRENKALLDRLSGYIAQELLASAQKAGSRKLIVRLVDLPNVQLRSLALKACEGGGTLTLLMAGENGQLFYTLACSEDIRLNMGEVAPAVNAALSGRGGGRGTLAQGSAKDTDAARSALDGLGAYLMQRLKDVK